MRRGPARTWKTSRQLRAIMYGSLCLDAQASRSFRWQIGRSIPQQPSALRPLQRLLAQRQQDPTISRLMREGYPWFTEPSTNSIGRFNPATTTSFEWYHVKTPSSGLAGLDLALGYVWFTERDGDRMGRLQKVGYTGYTREQPLPGADSAPTDIAVGADGCAWVSASGTNALVSWCAPYVRQLYLPLIQRK